MNGKRILRLAIGLAATPVALPVLAQEAERPPPVPVGNGSGLVELSDEEMGDMRGRYTVSSNTVAWFGVTMVSTWQNDAGQQLTSSMTVTMDVRQPGKPVVTFQPHVSITAIDAPPPPPSGQREIDNAGLANVTGVVQSVQVAGDGNVAQNTAQITVTERQAPPEAPPAGLAASTVATASAPGMNAVASVENNIARVLLQIDGHGAVEQWISRSGMGQTIQLATDGQQVSNRMELDLVRNTSQGRAALGQNVAQAIALSRGIAIGY
ncbi:hypothetical protein [Pseudoxanthomonas koreensis]|uniref:hypothetical protein n=1 Tax=Pseudoxanthomonas koreensis TaxID=266061 RepID=UPI001391226B|nr:hypothetical protein [Pseudoxanthomonas koreensis]KAF1691277.1 hypothetical protein CSC64_09735 [Pseudoxanthomonas koreensis]